MELRNEIENLESLVTEIGLKEQLFTEDDREKTLKTLNEESLRIQEAVWNNIFGLGLDRSRISAYIDYLLMKLADLSDKIYLGSAADYLDLENAKLQDALALISDAINKLIDYFKNRFGTYISSSTYAPKAYIEKVYALCKKESRFITSEMRNNYVRQELIKVIEKYLEDPLSLNYGNTKDAYHRLDYYQVFVCSLYAICKSPGNLNLEKSIIIELVYLNFNLLDFIWFSIKDLKPDRKLITDMELQINMLTIKRNEIMQLPVKHNYGYEPEAPTLKEVKSRVLKEEIRFFKKQNNINSQPRQSELSQYTQHTQYFEITFTIKELLFFCRLLIETGIFIIKTRSGIYQFISKHIVTKKHSSFSLGSLKRKYNHDDQKAIKKVRSTILDMLRLINEKYISQAFICYTIGEAFCDLPVQSIMY